MKYKNTREYLDSLNTYYYAIVSLPLIVFVFLYLKMQDGGGYQPVLLEDNIVIITQMIVTLLTLALLFYAFFRFKIEAREALLIVVLRKKLDSYYHASMKKFILLGLASLILLLGLFLTGNNFFVLFYLFVLILISVNRPTSFRIVRDLKMNKEEGERIIKNHDIE
jgi:hypothetical protein